ncbi:MAG: Uma2 family endonuclease [Candidatus Methylumidiphilus sp.]
MNWQAICENKIFKDIQYKVETNKWGKIELSPASNEHGIYQAILIEWLVKLGENGRPISECGIQTAQGVKVADVAWGSYAFFGKNKRQNPYQESPEVVIEILSPSNTRQEMLEKKELYFARGAKEFWVCDSGGNMTFFNNYQALGESILIKGFPKKVEIDFA